MTRLTLHAILGAVLVGALAACVSGAPAVKPSACVVASTPAAGIHALAALAPGGGGLEVVDHGFSPLGDGRVDVSSGALVRNTSDQIAYRAEVKLHLTDARGRDAVHPWSSRWLNQEIPVIRPGEQVAIGARLGLREDPYYNRDPAYKVTNFDVELGSATWVPPEDKALFPEFPAIFRGIGAQNSASPLKGVQFSVTSTSCRQMIARGTAVAFLDSSGHVVGGLIDGIGDQTHCGTEDYLKTTLEGGIPKGIDEQKTVVTEYCDPARPQWGTYRPSGAPVN
jgi:hypothetical protein